MKCVHVSNDPRHPHFIGLARLDDGEILPIWTDNFNAAHLFDIADDVLIDDSDFPVEKIPEDLAVIYFDDFRYSSVKV